MNKQRIQGATQKVVGGAKQAIGKAVGSGKLQRQGLTDKVVGSAKEVVGKATEAIQRATR